MDQHERERLRDVRDAARNAAERAEPGDVIDIPYDRNFDVVADETRTVLAHRNLRRSHRGVVEVDPDLPRVRRDPPTRRGHIAAITTVGTYGDDPADCYEHGYRIGRVALRGDHLPHPANRPHPDNFYHGMRAALRGRDLDVSAFLVVIDAPANDRTRPAAAGTARRA